METTQKIRNKLEFDDRMSTSILERPPVAQQSPPNVVELPLPCEERQKGADVRPANWITSIILKTYVNSFNYCLNELGWVPQRILEVGSGNGALLSYVAQTFMDAEVMGVEFDADKVAVAREHNCCRIEFVELLNSESLPFEADSFDLVISHGFLGASPLPRHWMKEMARVSAEAMIISAPTPIGYKWLKKLPGAVEAQLIGNPVFSNEVQPIAIRQMRTWLDRLGLQVEAMTTPAPYGMVLARKPQS